MFRITTDPYTELQFIHKKFLWWWVKWSVLKMNKNILFTRNNVTDPNRIINHLKYGKYQFCSGESPAYWILKHPTNWPGGNENTRHDCLIEYVESAQEYKMKHSEKFI